MLKYIYYGSPNEKHKIAYGKQTLAPRYTGDEFYQVRKLPSHEKAPHSLRVLRILPRQESFGFD